MASFHSEDEIFLNSLYMMLLQLILKCRAMINVFLFLGQTLICIQLDYLMMVPKSTVYNNQIYFFQLARSTSCLWPCGFSEYTWGV